LIILLSVAYSLPGFRWKGVAGADLLTNMVGFGVLCPLCGWTLLRPIESAPWWFIGTIALFLGALYAPTTASDYAADRAFGIRTIRTARSSVRTDGRSLGDAEIAEPTRDAHVMGGRRAKRVGLDPEGVGEARDGRGCRQLDRGVGWHRLGSTAPSSHEI